MMTSKGNPPFGMENSMNKMSTSTSMNSSNTNTNANTGSSTMSSMKMKVSNAIAVQDGKIVSVSFSDGSIYDFHSLWLRDACRDANHVAAEAGERILTATPIVGARANGQSITFDNLQATSIDILDDGTKISVHWNEDWKSDFDVDFLRRYALVGVAQCTKEADATTSSSTGTNHHHQGEWNEKDNIPTWLEPFTGFPDARAVKDYEITSWKQDMSGTSDVAANGKDTGTANGQLEEFVRYQYDDLMGDTDCSLALVMEMIQTVLNHGVVLIDGVPNTNTKTNTQDSDSSADTHDTDADTDPADPLKSFIDHTVGGLQKDPTRAEPNWKIVHQPNSSSISYTPSKRLNQHTDSSVPPHGIPALLLSMNYVEGYGANTLTDGFEIAKVLQAENPEGYHLLTKYGYDGERDFAASRIDSTQNIAKGLVINRRHPIFANDDEGNLTRLQYNEVFRMPSTLPFELFPQWYDAFSRFCELLHSDQYQRTVPMEAGTILLMNNWRVLHGRAGGRASPDRHVVGGTILRESVYSRAMQLARYLKGKDDDVTK
jgi:hypothetical protein